MIKIIRSPFKSFFSWIFREELNDLHYSITEHKILQKQYEKESGNVTSTENPTSILFRDWADEYFRNGFLNSELVLRDVLEDMRGENNFLKYYTTKTFKESLRRYCFAKDYVFKDRILKSVNNRIVEIIVINNTK